MLFYFNGAQIDQLKQVASTVKRDIRSDASYIAKRIIGMVKFENLKIDNNCLTICRDSMVYDYNFYSREECRKIEDEIEAEIKSILGVDSYVHFYTSGSHEEEPDPIPPLYWGSTDTVYHYNLTIELKF